MFREIEKKKSLDVVGRLRNKIIRRRRRLSAFDDYSSSKFNLNANSAAEKKPRSMMNW